MPPAPTAEAITRASRSNLALAFVALPRERRRDIRVFYAFCRLIDDIADDPGRSVAERRAALDAWRHALVAEEPGEPFLAPAVRALIARYRINSEHLREIIAGCEMDLAGASYETWEELRLYCHRVASVVGLVSIEIFGYRDPACRLYATELGLALQLTNILRDVGEDFANGNRIYLPREDLARFGYTAGDLAHARHDERFLALMRFEADRAAGFYENAAAALPPGDRRSMAAAEIMRAVYHRLLAKMRRENFRVFGRRTRLSRATKLALIAGVLVRNVFAPRPRE